MPYFVYIMCNRPKGVLYTGVTKNIARRSFEHKNYFVESFTKRHGIERLVYVVSHDDLRIAQERERRIKRWRRAWKIQLIVKDNTRWDDLFDQVNW